MIGIFVDPFPGIQYHVCIATNIPGYFIYAWIPYFVNEFLLLSLAVYKAVQYAKEYRHAGGGLVERERESKGENQ